MSSFRIAIALGLFAVALPATAQTPPFDHHNLPLDTDPFTEHQMIPSPEQVLGACHEPEPPLSDVASLQALGLTLTQEYSRYFNDAQAYLNCLERTKFAYIEVIREHGNALRNMPHQ